ncbi:hypothetical protein ACHHYP_01333 [Achlya hypogyna]|uniref:Peptidase M12A domain-containing protein n=1 Tax=Achlya hypogyna TaxID=1202772 RepID=A0A1V9ZTG3_ACHHY|nr:hypothetical protein ACHHYP_01333 [Achlya hypogyna]
MALLALVAQVQAKGFFGTVVFMRGPGLSVSLVCPAPCEAMFLPQDMESTEDCLCFNNGKMAGPDNKLSVRTLLGAAGPGPQSGFRCPKDSFATVLHPKAFADCECKAGLQRDESAEMCIAAIECTGRYVLKPNILHARTIADCACQEPYTKDDATGECYLDHCPRAANYVRKASLVGPVHSLADCDCTTPYTKNAQSGECFLNFECPAHSSPPSQGYAKSVADCTCDWGYVRGIDKTSAYCVPEKASFICPPHSRPLPTLASSPVNFMNCECAAGYERDEKLEHCKEPKVGGFRATPPPEFICPAYSVPMAPHPYSMRQCQCLPGFMANYGMQTCDWTPDFFKCPAHAYNPYPALPALDFMDCRCAKGFVRNDRNASCDPKPPLNENGCPLGALVSRWPVHDPNTDCFCLRGSVPQGPSMVGAEFQALARHYEGDEAANDTMVCVAVPAAPLCPANAVMNNWPVTKVSDCSCKSGYELMTVTAPAGATPAMVCAPTATSLRLPACAAGMSRASSDNSCRYGLEDVQSVAKSLGKIVVNGNELDYVLVEDDVMVTQGDIAVGVSFGFFDGDAGTDHDMLFYLLHGYYNMEKDSRWKNGKMCYTVDPAVAGRRADIQAAMAHITTNTGFSFIECHEWYCDDHLDDCDDFVDFTPTATSCYSFVGRIGGRQALGVGADCAYGNLVHVLLHAVGLHHPLVRPDRDAHVAVAWECVDAAKRSFFAVEHLEAIYGAGAITVAAADVPYDYYSIMHHRADAFVNASRPGCLSVIPRIEDVYARQEVLNEMGQRDKMSLTDIHYVWTLYPALKAAATANATVIPAVGAETALEVALETPEPPYHESRLHTKADAIDNHGPSTGNTVGAVVCVVGFLAVLGFAAIEMKRVAKRTEENHGKYADPLLSDPIYD